MSITVFKKDSIERDQIMFLSCFIPPKMHHTPTSLHP